MEKKMNIRLGFGCAAALLIAMMFASCVKEDIMSIPVEQTSEIKFGVDYSWDADKTKSSTEYYGEYKGDLILNSSDSDEKVSAGVYICDRIDVDQRPMTKGAVMTMSSLDKFGVYCKMTNTSGVISSYFSNLQVNRDVTTGKCTSALYYWPGSEYTSLDFLAVAPYDHGMLADSNNPTKFTYTVPTNATEQKDILVAKSDSYPGDSNRAVQLQFSHILSAVNVKIGDVPTGIIKSIRFINVFGGNCEYNVATNDWTLSTSLDDLKTFAVDLEEGGYVVNDDTATGTSINSSEATFMMIPQRLGENAMLEVVFHHSSTDRDVTLTSLLMGGEWPQGKTVNYLISITPESDLTFQTAQADIPIRDCHYDFQELVVKTTSSSGKWTMESDADWATLRLKPVLNNSDVDLYYKGFWVESYKGTTSINDQTINKNSTSNVIVYLYENVTDEDRVATISLYAYPNNKKTLVATRKILQYAPMWVDGKAYERIEEVIDPTNNPNNTFIWGYHWPETITYKGDVGFIGSLIFKILQLFGYASNVEINWSGTTATINTAGLSALGTNGSSTTDGLTNTTQLWSFKGGADLVNTMSLLEAWGMTYESGNDGATNLSSFAIRMVAYKNKHKETSETQGGNTVRVAELTEDGIQWYLPASGEIGTLINSACDDDETTNDTALNGDYWSSTAVSAGDTKNTHSYYYNATDNSSTKSANRNTLYKIRAARIKPVAE